MHQIFSALLLFLLLGISPSAQARICEEPLWDDGRSWYGKIFSGANFLSRTDEKGTKFEFQTGYAIAGSLGYRASYGLRMEIECAYRRNSIRKARFFHSVCNNHGHFRSTSGMVNLWWEAPLIFWGWDLWRIQPFIGGGIGYDLQQIHTKSEGFSFQRKKKGFAWQVLTGLTYPLFCHSDISIEYRFHKGRFAHLYSHSVGIGLTYRFAT